MIAGHLDGSLIDWPGRLVTVLFFSGCPLRCPYCYNGDVVLDRTGDDWNYDQALIHLRTPRMLRLLDGVVLSGGDPLYQVRAGQDSSPFLMFLRNLRAEGYDVKLDTSLACGDVDLLPKDLWYSVTLKPQSYYGDTGSMTALDNLGKLARRSDMSRLELRLTVQGGAVDDLLVTLQRARRVLQDRTDFAGLRISYEPVRNVDGHLFGEARVPSYAEYHQVTDYTARLFPGALHDIRSKEMVL